MNKPAKSKLCWNCEGTVSVAEETCPYCGVSVIPASLDGTYDGFSPPYRASQDDSVHHSPYASVQMEEKQTEVTEAVIDEAPDNEMRKSMFAVIFLLAGSVFFLFGLVLVLFSHHGVFTLQWDATHWYIYSLISLPLLVLGWRSFLHLD